MISDSCAVCPAMRACEQIDGALAIVARQCRPPGPRESGTGSLAEHPALEPQLRTIAMSLLEMMSDHSLVLRLVLAEPAFEPIRESLVQVGPYGLRKRGVRGVSYQEMAEAVGVITRQLRPLRTHELFAHESDQPLVDGTIAVEERGYGATMEDAALDGAPLQYGAFGDVELIESCRKQRMDRWRNLDLRTTRVAQEREHFLEKERIAFGHLHDPRPKLIRNAPERSYQRLGLRSIERLEQHRRGIPLTSPPSRPTLQQFQARHAEQQDRCVAREVG